MANSLLKAGSVFTLLSGVAPAAPAPTLPPATPVLPADTVAIPRDAIAMLEDMESVLRTVLCSERTDAIKHELRGLYLRYQDFRDKYPEDLPISRADARVRAHAVRKGEIK